MKFLLCEDCSKVQTQNNLQPLEQETEVVTCCGEDGLWRQRVGNPLRGDLVYGGGFKASISKLSEAAKLSLSYLRGQALHATVLGFDHPVSGKHLRFESELPSALARLRVDLKA